MTTTEETFTDLLRLSSVPPQLHDGLVNYLAHGIRPGSFLMAVLTNDLILAVKRADEECAQDLAVIVRWLYNCAPSVSWSSRANVEEWIAAKRQHHTPISEEVNPS